MSKYSKGEWTNCRYDICEIECDGEVYCTVATKDVDLIINVLNENEQLKQQSNSVYEIVKEYVMSHHCKSTMRMLKKIEKVMWND